jgi:hypothetical protein
MLWCFIRGKRQFNQILESRFLALKHAICYISAGHFYTKGPQGVKFEGKTEKLLYIWATELLAIAPCLGRRGCHSDFAALPGQADSQIVHHKESKSLGR